MARGNEYINNRSYVDPKIIGYKAKEPKVDASLKSKTL